MSQCMLCESNGAYRLRLQSTSDMWRTPLDVDGIYCSAHLDSEMVKIKEQLHQPMINFAALNTPKQPITIQEYVPPEPIEDITKDMVIVKNKPSRDRRVADKEEIEIRRREVKKIWDLGQHDTYKIADLLNVGRGAVY